MATGVSRSVVRRRVIQMGGDPRSVDDLCAWLKRHLREQTINEILEMLNHEKTKKSRKGAANQEHGLGDEPCCKAGGCERSGDV